MISSEDIYLLIYNMCEDNIYEGNNEIAAQPRE